MSARFPPSPVIILCLLLAPVLARAQQVTATTLPLRDKGAATWLFFNDIVLGIDYGGIRTKSARINAYSFSQQRLLWRQDGIPESNMHYEEDDPLVPDYAEQVLYFGNGPFNALDVRSGTIRWHKDCDEAGFVTYFVTQPIGASKLLIAGSDKCKGKSGDNWEKNMEQEKHLMLLNRATGEVIWTHRAKARTKTPGKFWGGNYTFNQRFTVLPLAPARDGGYRYSTGDDVERLLVLGDRLEAVNFADGALLWRTRDDVGSPAGMAGKFIFFVRDDHLNAYELGGTGTPAWSTPIHASSADVLTREDVDSATAQVLGPGDLFVSTPSGLFRLELASGSQKWMVKLGDSNWQLRNGLLFVATGDEVTTYDFATGTPKWELKAGPKLYLDMVVATDAKRVGLFVDRGDYHKDDDVFVGPYRLWGVDLASGTVVWSLADLDGRRIARYGHWPPTQVRVWGETGKCRTLTVADGSAATGPADANDRSVVYFPDDRTLRAHNWAGEVIWERKGERARLSIWPATGIVVWKPTSGPVEVIKVADGTSLWSGDMGDDPRIHADDAGRNIVIHHGALVTLVRVNP